MRTLNREKNTHSVIAESNKSAAVHGICLVFRSERIEIELATKSSDTRAKVANAIIHHSASEKPLSFASEGKELIPFELTKTFETLNH